MTSRPRKPSIVRYCLSDDFHEDEESTFKMEALLFPKHWYASIKLNDIATHKTTIWTYKELNYI